MLRRDVIAITASSGVDASLAIAACRAGADGVLDLEYASASAASAAIARLSRFTSGTFGVKVGPEAAEFLPGLLAEHAGRVGWVLLAGGVARPELADRVQALQRLGCRVRFEAVSLAEAVLGVQAGADGLILKGQEAGGRVGGETAFILLQQWLTHLRAGGRAVPAWVQGGISPNTAAACMVVGAAGVVLDAQLLLARESTLPAELRQRLQAFDGSETILAGDRFDAAYRIYTRPGLTAVAEILEEETRLGNAELSLAEKRAAWRQTLHRLARNGAGAWLLGQDAALARPLAARFATVAGIVHGLVRQVEANLASARRLQPLGEGAALAKQHGTQYPIVQGPMTRVSDTAAFAEAVSRGGGLPFLALALLRQTEAETLLRETSERLGKLPWGVGILGFVPAEVRKEQLAAIRRYPPPFALIAGGRPDQARELENDGIPTYLHVPSPGLLRMFLRDGARRFVFEGRECGGHVGPRTSFVLWEAMLEVLLEHLGGGKKGAELSIIFAGGIHDAVSAAMVAALAAPLAEQGVALGVLMGTAYLFTRDAVESGAIVARFQEEALRCRETTLLQTAPGHAIRCVPTPYCDDFVQERERLRGEGRSADEITRALEWRNVGRLRVASKGLDRASAGQGPVLVSLAENEQYQRGMYMIGQVASLRQEVTTIAALHEDVSAGSSRLLQALPAAPPAAEERHPKPCDIAIIGMSCFYPGANSLRTYWQNILDKVDTITEVPASHWDWRLYYDPDPKARDKIISKWGGFLQDHTFDPLVYGITPNSLHSIEPLQLFLLESVRLALGDAGYSSQPFPRERTAAVLGVGGGGSPLAVSYGFRTCLPLLETVPGLNIDTNHLFEKSKPLMPEWTEDSFPGFLLNVAVGRVANRFNLGGPNYAIDAACGSSLAAVYACMHELEMGTSDFAIALGADTVQTPLAYMAFSKTHALSPKGRCRPFDTAADGIVLSEGMGAIILKRLADAERDGDRIYGVIKGMGSSSDGRDKGLTAPRAEGQLRALRRAYAQAGISPAGLGLIEAHGTGTIVGDQTESQALGEFLGSAGAERESCPIGSVKSMIGHSKCAAGIAGVIKTTLALYHRVLPPTLVDQPNPRANFEQSPLYLNTEPLPWIHGRAQPRCAGVSAFGFGGTNFHAVISEYDADYLERTDSPLVHWPAELLLWTGADRDQLRASLSACQHALEGGARPALADLAAASWRAHAPDPSQPTLAIVAGTLEELREKLLLAQALLQSDKPFVHDPRGLYFAAKPSDQGGEVAFLFPGQGSQYPNMLAQTALAFGEVRQPIDRAEQALLGLLDRPLGRFIYPPSAFTPEQQQAQREALTRSDVAQPALGAVSLGMLGLLESLGLSARFLAGHSYGEYVALAAAGALSTEDLIRLSHQRGAIIQACAAKMPGGMLALDADADKTAAVIAGLDDVSIANSNAPRQTVISGSETGLLAALERCQAAGVRASRLPVACAFHSPLVAAASEPLARAIAAYPFQTPRHTVFANVTAGPHEAASEAIARTLVEHLTARVRFREEIEVMYAAGARIFVEVGPQNVLTGLVGQILESQPHLAVATDIKGRPGLVQLLHTLGQLLTHGVRLRGGRLFEGRELQPLELSKLSPQTGSIPTTATTWIINSVRSRPLHAPEPLLLGQQLQVRTPVALPTSAPTRSTTIAAPATLPAPAMNGQSASVMTAFPADDDSTQVMLRYQDLMARFLDTQKAVMTSFLQGGAAVALPALPTEIHTNGIAARRAPEQEVPVPSSNGQVHASADQEKPISVPIAAATNGAAAQRDRTWITGQLVELVSRRTGYPKEMLGLDLNLEADLGVDSIKRVEILAELAQSLGSDEQAMPEGVEMEKLTALGTMRGILDYLETALTGTANGKATNGTPALPPSNGVDHKTEKTAPGDAPGIQRALVELRECPLEPSAGGLLSRGAILFTDDGRGVAWEMANRLADFGQKTVLLRMPSETPESAGVYAADLTSPAAVEALLERVRNDVGTISGLVHLLPLAEAPSTETWDVRAYRETKSLYLLARALENDLRESGRQGNACLLAATALGGVFGFGSELLPDDYSPSHGGVLGFVKCLAQEWPEVLIRAVDVESAGRQAGDLAERFLAELSAPTGPSEVGYRDGRRWTWASIAEPLSAGPTAAAPLDPGDVVLVTGGARGITAAIACELARRYRPTLLVVGRSPLPPETEDADTASLTTAASIKAALIARIERAGRPSAPAVVESAYRRLLQEREIRVNLAKLRSAGAAVHYFSADVRDEASFGGLLDDLQQRFGPFTGVIHGAGVIEDRLVHDKTPESFDRVFQTKVVSARILSGKLRQDRLRFCVFFASLASRYGNRGQADYAAANEVLSKLALALDRRWQARVLSIAWGPWAEIGMVADLEKHLVQRGLRLISPREGPELLIAELLHGRKGESEVIYAGGAEALVQPVPKNAVAAR